MFAFGLATVSEKTDGKKGREMENYLFYFLDETIDGSVGPKATILSY